MREEDKASHGKSKAWANTTPTLLALFFLSLFPLAKQCLHSFFLLFLKQYRSHMSKASPETHSKQRRHFSTRSTAERKSKAGIYWGRYGHIPRRLCVCYFNAQAAEETERDCLLVLHRWCILNIFRATT